MIKILLLVSTFIGIHGYFHIPLQKSENGNSFSGPATASKITKRQSHLHIGSKYYFFLQGQVSIGTPAQTFQVLFDTGSPDVWVKTNEHDNLGENLFNASASSSFEKLDNVTDYKIMYFDGSAVKGYYGKDMLSLGSLNFNDFPVLLATDVMSFLSDDPIKGIFGLSFHQLRNGGDSFVVRMGKRQLVSKAISYYIDLTDSNGGLTFGGIDIARYHGELNWIPLIPTNEGYLHWRILLTNISIAGIPLDSLPSISAIMDTGTSMSVFSEEVARKINTHLNLDKVPLGLAQTTYGTMCDGDFDKFPDISFSFGNTRITIPATTYMILSDVSGITFCISGVFGSDKASNNQSILGNLFLRQFYTVFDYGALKIGISNANREIDVVSNIIEADSRNSPIGIAKISSIGGKSAANRLIYRINYISLVLYVAFVVLLFFGLYVCIKRCRSSNKRRADVDGQEQMNQLYIHNIS